MCKAVIKAKGGFFEESEICFDLFTTFLVTTCFHMCYFIVLMTSLLFYNVENCLKKTHKKPFDWYCTCTHIHHHIQTGRQAVDNECTWSPCLSGVSPTLYRIPEQGILWHKDNLLLTLPFRHTHQPKTHIVFSFIFI